MNFAGQPQFPWLQAKHAENEDGQETPSSSSDEGPDINPAELMKNPQPALPRAAAQPKRWSPQQQQKPASVWSSPRRKGWGHQNSGPRSARRGRGAAQNLAVPIAAPQAPPRQRKANTTLSASPLQSKPAVMLRAVVPQSNPLHRPPPPQPKPSVAPRAPPVRKTTAVRGSQQDGAKPNPWSMQRNIRKPNAWARRGNSQQQSPRIGVNSQRASSIPGPPKAKPLQQRAVNPRRAKSREPSQTAVIPDLEGKLETARLPRAKPSQQRGANLRLANPQPHSQAAVIPDFQGKLETARMENQKKYQPFPRQQPSRFVNEQQYQQLVPQQHLGMGNQPWLQNPASQRPVRMVRQPGPQLSPEKARPRYVHSQVSQRHHVRKGYEQPLKAEIYAEGNTQEGVSPARKKDDAKRLQAVVPDLSETPEGAAPMASRVAVGRGPVHTTSEGCSTWVNETGCHCPQWGRTSSGKEQE